MKTIKIIAITLFLITLNACQDVVEVDLQTGQERLVIEAFIGWDEGTVGNEQSILLTKTASFYTNEIVYATGAQVKITNLDTTNEFIFTETTPGNYETSTFVPITGDRYRLDIVYDGNSYQGEETLLPTPTISTVDQSVSDGFSSTEPEINTYFQDYANEENFYRIVIDQSRPSSSDTFPSEQYNYSDDFQDGALLKDFYESDDIEVGDVFDITLYSISSRFNDFLDLITEQSNSGFGPFSSPPVNVKGNCINTTNQEDYPYGYFVLTQVSHASYTFQ